MKTKNCLAVMTILCVTLSLVMTSCKKDKDSPNKLEKSYFSVKSGTFKNAAMPDPSGSSSAPVINSVYGNSSIIEGGSNPLSIGMSSSVKEILIGVKDIDGYYTISGSSWNSSTLSVLVTLLFSQALEQDSFVIEIALRDDQGLVSEHAFIQVNKIEAGTGKLQISCSWDKPNDVDLHLVEPNGEEICYRNKTSDNGGSLDVDSNAGCDMDNINNENITYDNEAIIQSGKYIVRVDFYSNCSVASNTNFIVTVRYNGNFITPTSGSNPYEGFFTPANADQGGYGAGREIMTFSISPAKSVAPVEKRLTFVYPGQVMKKDLEKGSPF